MLLKFENPKGILNFEIFIPCDHEKLPGKSLEVNFYNCLTSTVLRLELPY
jgi:hypothetical protein